MSLYEPRLETFGFALCVIQCLSPPRPSFLFIYCCFLPSSLSSWSLNERLITLNKDMWIVITMSSNRLDICEPEGLRGVFFSLLPLSFFFSIPPVLLLSVPGAEAIKQEVDGDGQKQNWECKKVKPHFQLVGFFFSVKNKKDSLVLFLATNYCFLL